MPSKKEKSERIADQVDAREAPVRPSPLQQNSALIILVVGVLLGGSMVYFMGNYRLISKDRYNQLLSGQPPASLGPLPPPGAPPGAPANPPAPPNAPSGPSGQLVGEVQTFDLSNSPTMGPANAPVSVVVFSDFECPACAQWAPEIKRIATRFQDKIKLSFKHLPLPFHPKAKDAAVATEAAKRQDKFWEMHDLIFANPRALNQSDFVEHARELGLDLNRFKSDLDDGELKNRVQRDLEEAQRSQVPGTPTFFINGRRAHIGPPQQLEALIAQVLENEK